MATTYLFIFYCFEAGIFFIVIPWSRFWALNPLLHYSPSIVALTDNNYIRGLISGFGLVHIMVGLVDLSAIVGKRRARERK
ncbi:MAG TPA: hypothetical protein VHL58_13220 [Thermoanaerobaculia bacterium]|nr:hypothetical protein [Thermoanaerobaculia bacterium]